MRRLVCAFLLLLALPVAAQHDGQHDFDFEIGTWKTHVRRRLPPLTGSTTWIDMDGISALNVERFLGPARERHAVGPFTVFVWDRDIRSH